MITIDWRDLGIAEDAVPFAEGAVGELFHVTKPIPELPGRTLVFKRVKQNLPGSLTPKQVLAQMRSVVAFRDGMSTPDLAELDDVTVWPLAMVRKSGVEVGILIDLIGKAFFVDSKPAGGVPGRVLFELQFLCVSDGYFNKRGIDPNVAGDGVMRLALAARLAYALEVVHRRPVVFGDLHLKNAVATALPHARVLLMDCDSVAELSDNNRVQLHGLGFIPPEIQQDPKHLQDQQTDIYKLGLCIIRALSPGKGATQASDPARIAAGILDQKGIDLLRRAVSPDRSIRPKAKEIREYLVERVRGLITLPELLSAELSHRVALRGSDVFVRWEHKHGTEVRIYGVNGYSQDAIDATVHSAGFAIKPPYAGPIDIEVWNKYGPSARLRAGVLEYFELPDLDIAGQLRGIPRPVIPEVPALDAKIFAKVKPYPAVTFPAVNVEYTAPQVHFPPVQITAGANGGATRIAAGVAKALETLNQNISKAIRRSAKELGEGHTGRIGS